MTRPMSIDYSSTDSFMDPVITLLLLYRMQPSVYETRRVFAKKDYSPA